MSFLLRVCLDLETPASRCPYRAMSNRSAVRIPLGSAFAFLSEEKREHLRLPVLFKRTIRWLRLALLTDML